MALNLHSLRMASGGSVPAEKWNALIAALEKAQVLSVVNFERHQGVGGIILVPPRPRKGGGAAAAPEVFPFDVTVSGASDPRDVTVRPGTVNNLLPSNMFSVGATPVSGTRYVTLVLTFSTGEVTGALLSMDTVAPDASPVTEGTPPTTLTILLAVIVDTVVFQVRHGNITVTPVEAFRADRASPASPGELPYSSWWQWSISP